MNNLTFTLLFKETTLRQVRSVAGIAHAIMTCGAFWKVSKWIHDVFVFIVPLSSISASFCSSKQCRQPDLIPEVLLDTIFSCSTLLLWPELGVCVSFITDLVHMWMKLKFWNRRCAPFDLTWLEFRLKSDSFEGASRVCIILTSKKIQGCKDSVLFSKY